MNIHRNWKYLCATVFLAANIGAAQAEQLSVVGSWSGLPLHKKFEAPFWNGLEAASNGVFSVNLTTFDQMGVSPGDVFRLLGDGVYDIGMATADYAVSDAPELEGLDVPLIAENADAMKKVVDASRPMLETLMRERFNAHVLAVVPYPPQIIFCDRNVSGLKDLAGLKVRGSGRMTAKFLEALGAEGITLAFSEVPGALQRGVIDCAVTGAGSGYSAGWWEVTSHLVTMPIGGWDPVITAINLDKWNALSSEQQQLLQKRLEEDFEAKAWKDADASYAAEVACLTGGECTLGKAAAMSLVSPDSANYAAARDILVSTVLPEWGQRTKKEWIEGWNATVGKLVSISIAAK